MELDYFGESSKSAVELIDSQDALWRCKKPTSSITLGRLMFNSGSPVPIDGIGDMQLDPFAIALADLTTALSPGDECGPVASSWYVQKSGTGLLFRSYDTTRAHYVSATIRTIFVSPNGGGGGAKYAARLMGSWSANAASCQIYTLSSATVVYKETATVYDPLSVFAALVVNDWMYCTNQAGVYYGADPAGCPTTCPLIASPPATQP